MYFKPRIFISSVMKWKKQLRSDIKSILEQAGGEVILFEKDLTPSIKPNTYRTDIIDADFVIFIIDENYGAKTNLNISGTEEEFNIVMQHNKPCHVYLKHIKKTADAKKFEDNIKSKGISYYYYNNLTELVSKLQKTIFTIAKDIILSDLDKQKIEPNLIKKLAVKQDYNLGLMYCKRFERIFDIYKQSQNFIHSDLLILSMDGYAEYFLQNIVFIDKKLDDNLKAVFLILKNLNGYVANNSTHGQTFYEIEFTKNEIYNVSLNSYCPSYNSSYVEQEILKLRTAYDAFKSYVSAMKIESDIFN